MTFGLPPIFEMNDQSDVINSLVKFAKELSDVNKDRARTERILAQLTFFQNFVELTKRLGGDGECEISKTLFKFYVQVLSGTGSDEAENNCDGPPEDLLLVVENMSENPLMSFDPEFWHFTLDWDEGRQVSTWFLQNPFGPGAKERFLFKLPCSILTSYSPVQLNVQLSFFISWEEQNFLKVFQGSRFWIDCLFLLSPGRRVGPLMDQAGLDPCCMEDSVEQDESLSIPPIVRFDLCLNKDLANRFVQIFLEDSLHRGFSSLITQLHSSPEFSVYVYEDRVLVALAEDRVSIRCANSKLLFSVKIAIYRRLLQVKGLRVEAPPDYLCDKLYQLKLRLETTEDMKKDLPELYLLCREITDNIKFSM